jgi:lipopolysaccharide assembly protein A
MTKNVKNKLLYEGARNSRILPLTSQQPPERSRHMSFLKTIFWVIIVVGFVVFALNNWQPISLRLWGGMWLDTKLPALIGVAFLLGYVPLYFWHKAQGFRFKRRIATLESAARPAPLDLREMGSAPIQAPL